MTTPSSPHPLSIRLLGEWRITRDGMPSAGKLYGKVVALLAYLAVGSDRAHSREHLASLLWPLLPADAARTNLRQTLHYLRQAFGANASRLLTANRNTVRFSASRADCRLDVDTLTAPLPVCDRCIASGSPALCPHCLGQIQSRLDAYQGEFLAGLAVTNAPDFDVWLDEQRQRLRGQAFLLSEKLCGAYGAASKLDLALSHAQRCVQLEPWNEAAHRQHMRLLAEKGQHGTAQAYYDTYRASLGHDQNAEPEASTRALFQTIHRHGLASKHTPLPGTQTNPPRPGADRRPVTILCCHLDGAPGMADTGPEQLAELRSVCATVLRRYAGHVTQGHDGYIYAYMGYPAASEQAGRHAAQAALELQACFDARHRLRVGIHTETIITGIDPSLPDIVGDASALAWQLCRRMNKGGIAISDTTECLLHSRFHLQAMKPLNAKRANGATAPATHLVYKLTAPAQAEAVAPPRPTSLIGRRTELLRLKKLWHKASRGSPQFLVIRADAGMGKTRLVRSLCDEIGPSSSRILHLYCYPEHQHTPLHPVIALFKSMFGFSADDTLARQRAKLRHYLRQNHPAIAPDTEPILMALLSIAPADAPVLTPRQRKQQTLDTVLLLFDGMAARHTLLLVVEDAQWLDVTSLDLLERLLRRKTSSPLLTLINARENFRPDWLEADSVLDLQPLKDNDIARLARATVHFLPRSAIDRIVERADGVPLYAEEMAQISPDAPEQGHDIPTSLRYLLLARLDSVPQARRILQTAATIGRKFEPGLLRRINKLEAPALESALRQLADARLISPVPSREDGFQFHHALIQEAAYESQIQADRQEAHRRVAEALQAHYPQRAAQQPGEIARHYTAAGNAAAAIPWWLQAGRQALRVSANAEAGEHLQKGLNLVRQLPRDDTRDSLELELLLPLGQSILLLRGYGSHEAVRVYDRALALDNSQRPVQQRFEIVWGLWMVSSSRPGSSFLKSRELARELLQLAKTSGDDELLVQAYSANINIALWRNQIHEAHRYGQAALALPGIASRNTLEGLDPRVTNLAYLSWVYWRQHRTGNALAASRQSLDLAQSLDNPDTMCFALGFAAMLQRFLGNTTTVADYAARIKTIADTYQLALWQGVSSMLLAWTQVHAGNESGIAVLRACAQGIRQIMPGVAVMFVHALAEAYGFLGRFDEQLQTIDEGLQSARMVHEGLFKTMLEDLRRKCPAA